MLIINLFHISRKRCNDRFSVGLSTAFLVTLHNPNDIAFQFTTRIAKHCNYTSPMLMARAISPSTSAARIMPSATLLSPPVCCFLLREAVLRLCFVPVLRLRAEVFCCPAVLLRPESAARRCPTGKRWPRR